MQTRLSALSAILIGSVFVAAPAAAADPAAEFYKGKQLTIIGSTDPGGAYDTHARILARHIGKHIPGHPNIIVQNMPGANGLKTTNYMANAAPHDGSVIAGVHSSVPTAPLTSPDGVQFDVNKLSWLGSITKDTFVGYVWHTAPIQGLNDAKTTPIIMGGTGVGAAGVDMAILANDFFGFKFKIVTGYKSATEVRIAIERGEVQGTFMTNWPDVKAGQAAWLRENKIRVISQYGFEPHPDLPDVPLFIDQAKTDADRQALLLMLARQEFGKPYFAPPDIPADRLAILRRAFDDTMKDREFVAETNKAGLGVDGPLSGEALAAIVAKVAATPRSAVARIEQAITAFTAGAR